MARMCNGRRGERAAGLLNFIRLTNAGNVETERRAASACAADGRATRGRVERERYRMYAGFRPNVASFSFNDEGSGGRGSSRHGRQRLDPGGPWFGVRPDDARFDIGADPERKLAQVHPQLFERLVEMFTVAPVELELKRF
jgi:hypothetical protein